MISWCRTVRFFGSSLKARWGWVTPILKQEVLEKQVLKPRNVIGKWEGKKSSPKQKNIKKSSGQLVISYQPTEKKLAISQIYTFWGNIDIHLIGRHLKRMFYGTSLKPETHLPDIPSFAHTLAGSRPWIGHGFSRWNADLFGVCRWSYERK